MLLKKNMDDDDIVRWNKLTEEQRHALLTPHEYQVFLWHSGLDTHLHLSYTAIGILLGVPRTRARQIGEAARKKLQVMKKT